MISNQNISNGLKSNSCSDSWLHLKENIKFLNSLATIWESSPFQDNNLKMWRNHMDGLMQMHQYSSESEGTST